MAKHEQYLRYFLPQNEECQVEPTSPYVTHNATTNTARSFIIEYIGERQVEAHCGESILEVSLKHSIPHLSSCGGTARCSTCRVEIVEGLQFCEPPNPNEQCMAQARGFPDSIRLACQTKVHGPIRLKRLIFDEEDVREVAEQKAIGKEKKLAVLFCDVRSFTPFVEQNLPYDVVHLLNRYFNAIGKPIHAHYGYIDKYIGDGIMVLFGLNPQRETHPCLDAVHAALGMLRSLDKLNEYCMLHFQHEFKIGIGIHYGAVIIGEIGFHLKRDFTALGDVVNTAARIESATKQLAVPLLVSDAVKQVLPAHYLSGKSTELNLKGKQGQYRLHEINLALLDE